MAASDIQVPTDSEGFWEWLRKRGDRQHQEISQIEATLDLPKAPKPLSHDSETNKDIWTDVDYTIYEL